LNDVALTGQRHSFRDELLARCDESLKGGRISIEESDPTLAEFTLRSESDVGLASG
jgi:hypothetical protein